MDSQAPTISAMCRPDSAPGISQGLSGLRLRGRAFSTYTAHGDTWSVRGCQFSVIDADLGLVEIDMLPEQSKDFVSAAAGQHQQVDRRHDAGLYPAAVARDLAELLPRGRVNSASVRNRSRLRLVRGRLLGMPEGELLALEPETRMEGIVVRAPSAPGSGFPDEAAALAASRLKEEMVEVHAIELVGEVLAGGNREPSASGGDGDWWPCQNFERTSDARRDCSGGWPTRSWKSARIRRPRAETRSGA